MKGRLEHKFQTDEKMRIMLKDKPSYVKGFYNELFLSEQYLTAQKYTLTALRFLKFIDYNLQEFTKDNVIEYLISIKGRDGGESSDSVKITTRAALSRFGEYLSSVKAISDNPVKEVGCIKMRDNPQQVYLTMEELNIIQTQIRENTLGTARERARRKLWIERNLAIFMLFCHTGIRVTALVELNLEDYDREKKTITVIEKREKLYSYDLNQFVVDILDDWLKKREILLEGKESNAFFISNRRTRMTSKSVRDLIAAYTEGMEKHITPHKLRASYATNIYLETKDIYYVQRLLHHESSETTTKYIKAAPLDSLKATNIMSRGLQ